MAVNLNPSGRQADTGFAAALLAAAGWAFAEAGSYPGASGTYPQVLAVLLAIGAALVMLRSLMRPADPDGPRLFLHAGRFVLGLAVVVAYVVSIDLIGYLLPSLAVAVLVPLLLGYRDLPLTVAVAVGTVATIVLVFYVILGRPLPPDILDPVLAVLR